MNRSIEELLMLYRLYIGRHSYLIEDAQKKADQIEREHPEVMQIAGRWRRA